MADAGYVVVGAGGGGIPVVRDPDGTLRGVEAVIDKDLAAALLARDIGAEVLVIATDVEHVVLGYGTDDERPLAPGDGRRRCARSRRSRSSRAAAWARRSRLPCRFVESGGRRAVITSLEMIEEAVHGRAGTVIERERS